MADPRSLRSRAALVDAFTRLLLEKGYDAITPTSIAASAHVARSTFYEHYSGKPDLLRSSLNRIFGVIAQAGFSTEVPCTRTVGVLEHFWAKRGFARALMKDRPRLILQSRLAEMIVAEMRSKGYVATIPSAVVALQISNAHIAVLDSWLAGTYRSDAATMERVLRDGAASLLKAFGQDFPATSINAVRKAKS